jgi:hypothetical protein
MNSRSLLERAAKAAPLSSSPHKDTASPSLPTLNGAVGNGWPTFPPSSRRTVSTEQGERQ